MRKALDRQRRLDCPSVTRVSLNLNGRNETIPILRGLQHIYSTPKVRDPILKAIARDVNGASSAKYGRPGLSYWEILVLAAARLGCGYDDDQLQDLAENHRALRRIMGIGDWESEEETENKKRFDWRRIESNITLLRPETIEHINQAIIKESAPHVVSCFSFRESRKAERHYRAVDPENRLVARTLEQQREQALQRERQVEEDQRSQEREGIVGS